MIDLVAEMEETWRLCRRYGGVLPEVIIVPGSWMHRVRVHGRVRVRRRGRWVTRPAARWCLRPEIWVQPAPVVEFSAVSDPGRWAPEPGAGFLAVVKRAERHWTTLDRGWRGKAPR